VIHIPGTLRLREYGVLNIGEPPGDWMLEKWIKNEERFLGFVATPIFVYNYDQ